jgi:predicted transposase YbfD/YdcC
MVSLITILRDVPDPRTGNATRHDLLDVLMIALVASICGCESCAEFADFAEDREELLREFLGLEHGLPSHATFSRLFRLIDPAALALCFGRFLDELGRDGAGVIAIDGKTLRRSFDRAAGASALHVVTAFATETRLVLGQRAVAAGENEITAARALLGCLDLTGSLVTADAIHCQRETAALIRERGGDYLLALKGNRPAMLAEVEAFFADPPEALARHETTDADHGRIEVRRHAVTQSVDWLFSDRRYVGEPAMPGLASLAMVEASVERGGTTTRAVRYYLSSAHLTPERFAQAVRAHWGIENSLHWVLDTTFDEDRARNRKDHGPANLAIIRKLALNVLRTARSKISIRRKRKRSGWSDAFARSIIGQMR